jgi:hypothetical protein
MHERGSHMLHQKAVPGCHEEGVLRRPVRSSAHVRVEEGRPIQSSAHGRVKEGRLGARDGAYGGANDDYGGQGRVAHTAVLAKASMAATTSNGPSVPTTKFAVMITTTTEKDSPARGWRHVAAMVHAAVPGGALTTAVAAKATLEGAPVVKLARALVTTAEDRMIGGWGRMTAVLMTCSWEASWMVTMAVTRAARATSAAAEATTMYVVVARTLAEGVAMTMAGSRWSWALVGQSCALGRSSVGRGSVG